MKKTHNKLYVFGSSFSSNDHLYPIGEKELSKWAINNWKQYYDRFSTPDDIKGGWPTLTSELLEMELYNASKGGSTFFEMEDGLLRCLDKINEGDIVIIEVPFNNRHTLFSPITGVRIAGAEWTLGDVIDGIINEEQAQSYIDYQYHWHNEVSTKSWDKWYMWRLENWVKLYKEKGAVVITWVLIEHNKKYETVGEHTKGVINDFHWSIKGNVDFFNDFITRRLVEEGVIKRMI